jgi:hypothetical protein
MSGCQQLVIAKGRQYFFQVTLAPAGSMNLKADQSMQIVESERISDRLNSHLKSKAQIGRHLSLGVDGQG